MYFFKAFQSTHQLKWQYIHIYKYYTQCILNPKPASLANDTDIRLLCISSGDTSHNSSSTLCNKP